MEQPQRTNLWAAGESYEPYVGRWSRHVAAEFVAWLAVPEGKDWLDLGCGTGALTQNVLERAAPRSIVGLDPSSAFIAFARARVADPRARFEIADARALPLEGATVDVAVAGLVLNFVPQPERALAELSRVLRPGGVAAAYVWDYAEKMELMRRFWDAAAALDPAAAVHDEGRRFGICHPERLAALFSAAGLRDVATRPIEIATVFRDFDDYWTPFLGGVGPAPAYATSLSLEARTALRERLRAELPTAEDGSIHLVARAWAVRGRTPR